MRCSRAGVCRSNKRSTSPPPREVVFVRITVSPYCHKRTALHFSRYFRILLRPFVLSKQCLGFQHVTAKREALRTERSRNTRTSKHEQPRVWFTCGRRNVSKRRPEAAWQLWRACRDASPRPLTAFCCCSFESSDCDSTQAACQTTQPAAKISLRASHAPCAKARMHRGD